MKIETDGNLYWITKFHLILGKCYLDYKGEWTPFRWNFPFLIDSSSFKSKEECINRLFSYKNRKWWNKLKKVK